MIPAVLLLRREPVASFLGLGLTLIGIGYVYRRFVFR